jgi:hypothetical protein
MSNTLTNKNFLNFLINLEVNDYYQQDDILVGFSIIDLEKKSNIIKVRYEFYSIRDENEQLGKLFEIEDSPFDEYFPASVYKMELTEKYIWESSELCDELDENTFVYETISINATDIPWGDIRMPRDMIDKVIEKLDPLEIASTLINRYEATKTHLPEFIPLAIRKKIHQCVIDYLDKLND